MKGIGGSGRMWVCGMCPLPLPSRVEQGQPLSHPLRLAPTHGFGDAFVHPSETQVPPFHTHLFLEIKILCEAEGNLISVRAKEL